MDGRQAAIACFDSKELDDFSSIRSNVLECDYMEQLLLNDDTMQLVPKVEDNDAQRETVLTRGAMCCPWELVLHEIGKN